MDARGRKITLPAPPRRIVSLSPGNTEMLFALGLEGRIVADTTYCDYPPAAVKLPKIGSSNTSTEKVVAMRPDLVVASVSANRTAIPPLERLNAPVFAIDPQTVPETYDALRKLGRITGAEHEAEEVIREMQSGFQKVAARLPKTNRRPRVLMIVQENPLMVVGPGNWMDDLITLAGGENAGREAGKPWAALSPERVPFLAPDVIITGRSSVASVKRRAGWSTVPAVKSGAVFSLDGNESVRPGPRLVIALEKLAGLIRGPSSPPGPR